MFLEIHEPTSSNEHFNWFDEKGILIDSEDPAIKLHLSTINRYIIEIDKNNPNKVPEFENGYIRMIIKS